MDIFDAPRQGKQKQSTQADACLPENVVLFINLYIAIYQTGSHFTLSYSTLYLINTKAENTLSYFIGTNITKDL